MFYVLKNPEGEREVQKCDRGLKHKPANIHVKIFRVHSIIHPWNDALN